MCIFALKKRSEVPHCYSHIFKGSFKKNHTVYDIFSFHLYDAHTVLGHIGIMSSPLSNSRGGDGIGPYLEINNKI